MCITKRLSVSLMVVSFSSLAFGSMNPINVSGWNQDIVIATSETAITGATAAMDGGDASSGATVYYEQGFNTSSPTSGLKSGLLQSTTTSDLNFQLQSFTANNALYEGGTLTLASAAMYDRIALIGATGDGTSDLTITFKYATGADTVFSSLGTTGFNQDWFNGSSVAYTANGRVSTVSGNFDFVDSGNPRLYESFFDIDGTRLLQSVVITDANLDTKHHSTVMAISGQAIPEPASIALIGLFGGGCLMIRRFFMI